METPVAICMTMTHNVSFNMKYALLSNFSNRNRGHPGFVDPPGITPGATREGTPVRGVGVYFDLDHERF